jgi:hypothetical protein
LAALDVAVLFEIKVGESGSAQCLHRFEFDRDGAHLRCQAGQVGVAGERLRGNQPLKHDFAARPEHSPCLGQQGVALGFAQSAAQQRFVNRGVGKPRGVRRRVPVSALFSGPIHCPGHLFRRRGGAGHARLAKRKAAERCNAENQNGREATVR